MLNSSVTTKEAISTPVGMVGSASSEDINTLEKISALSQMGYQMIKKDAIDEALECFQQILNIDSHNNYALVGKGDALRKVHNFEEAIEYYEACLRLNPDNSFALFGLAESLQSIHKYQDSIECWLKYLDYDNNDAVVLTRLADAYRKLDNYHKAKALYEQALKIEPYNKYTLVGMGWVHFKDNNYEEALKHWLTVIQHYTQNDVRIYTVVGNCYRKIRDFHSALVYFKHAAAIDKNNLFVMIGLADSYRGIGEYSKAVKYLKQVIQQDPTNSRLIIRLGELYENIGKYDLAKEHYNKVLAEGYDIFAALGMARLHKHAHEYQKALESLKELKQHNIILHRVNKEIKECYRRMKMQKIEGREQKERENLLVRVVSFLS